MPNYLRYRESYEFSPTSRYRLVFAATLIVFTLQLFAVNFLTDVGSEDSHAAYQLAPLHGWLLPPHSVSRFAGARAR